MLPRLRIYNTRRTPRLLGAFLQRRAVSTAGTAENQVQRRLEELRSREHIAQRSAEWHTSRMKLITEKASEVASFLCNTPETLKEYHEEYGIDPDFHHYGTHGQLSPFKSKTDVMGQKLNPDEKKRKSTPSTRWGISFEPVAMQHYEQYYQAPLEEFGLLVHQEYDWLGASVDAVERDTGIVVEIKCPYRPLLADELENEAPEVHYWVQVQIQMAVLGLTEARLHTCRFIQYEDMVDYLNDHDPHRLSGCMLFPRLSKHPAIRPPPDMTDKAEICEWAARTIEEIPDLKCKPRYWYLSSFTTKPIIYSERWFSKILPILKRSALMLNKS